ncbi:MAG: DUF4845 domain-containing protein [Hydrogenophaga sp.]|jgi:hypothetical protein|uniref:DUF4845 domain-containing protein n=1 Tax=Hydrogenophaga sp. TaxID=1904254 RepID=UPI00274F0CF9|nr:DUF4845 domain-containing protein [Hydrogenophaga sp.]MDP2419480.1 DUF4845 domain-containing protein [Hydrogenophaga sp.]MDZ4186750.1 DUF4845 domain-containing protein [Hydrogenophaga sp.]
MKMKQQQRGLTFLGLLIVGILLAFTGVILAQVVPTYVEFMAVQKAAKKAATGSTVSEVRGIFDKSAQVDNINSISGKDLEVGKEGDLVVVTFAYSREIHLAGPAYLTMKYEGSSK